MATYSPDDVVTKLATLNVNVSRRTLLNYETWDLIDKPKRGGGGTGGRWTEYPRGVVEQSYAAWCLLHGEYVKNNEIMTELIGEKAPAYSPGIVRLAKIAGSEYLSIIGWDYYEEFRLEDFQFNVNTTDDIFLCSHAENTLDKIAFDIGSRYDCEPPINSADDLPSYFKNIVKAAAFFWMDRCIAANWHLSGHTEIRIDGEGRRFEIMKV